MIDLEAERAAARARYEAQMAEGWARALLEKVGWTAGEEELRAGVESERPNHDPQGVVDAARRLQEGSESRVRKLNREEIETVAKSRTQESLEGLRRLLRDHPELATRTLYDRLTREGVNLLALSSFTSLASQVRKELGIDGKAQMKARRRKRRATRSAKPTADTECVRPSPKSSQAPDPVTPPARVDSGVTKPASGSPDGQLENPDQDLHTPGPTPKRPSNDPQTTPEPKAIARGRVVPAAGTGTVDRLLDAIRRKKEQLAELERDLEELRTALRVVKELEEEAA